MLRSRPVDVPFTSGLMNSIHAKLMLNSRYVTILSSSLCRDDVCYFCPSNIEPNCSIGCGMAGNRPFISFTATIHFMDGTNIETAQTYFQRYSDNSEFWTDASFGETRETIFVGGGTSIAGRCDARPLFLEKLFFEGVAIPDEKYTHEYNFNIDDSKVVKMVTLTYPAIIKNKA